MNKETLTSVFPTLGSLKPFEDIPSLPGRHLMTVALMQRHEMGPHKFKVLTKRSTTMLRHLSTGLCAQNVHTKSKAAITPL